MTVITRSCDALPKPWTSHPILGSGFTIETMRHACLVQNSLWSIGLLALLAAFFVAHPACAQQAPPPDQATLPESPRPESPPHRFWDRTNILLFSGVAVFRGLDYASTRNFMARGREEILLPDDVVNNSAGFASLEAAATVTSVGLSYLMHRTNHHKLERWVSITHISVTAFGDARNYALKSKHH